MVNGIELNNSNHRVRITKVSSGKGVVFHIQIRHQQLSLWINVAHAGNIKQARVIATCFAALVEA